MQVAAFDRESSRKLRFGVIRSTVVPAMGTRADGRLRQDEQPYSSAGVLVILRYTTLYYVVRMNNLTGLQVCSLYCALAGVERDIVESHKAKLQSER